MVKTNPLAYSFIYERVWAENIAQLRMIVNDGWETNLK
jgi:hypothetical protein